ncbi:flagellar basal body rod protein FlgG [Virgibacillus halodenitrificans]|jgi:flagellar hook protein FlgE|uniref:Flagellar hook protein FlgE n=1 Tax=Virgibacillus halodenitrificans TaxID=1482 RepID=A0AAC9NLF8_VIRHA|nr:flagellar basal body rod protein FlgG [Virgibacillus halodenitrificans]APC48626.1 flagellar basal body rod protein FlgG [Virgibacillus halodenitrificans]MCG1028707.1 flagellar basal body rod protein FlgG [Virgibacillus halodenitrificans]MCJ0931200.1 flagellar basal body rod protein FlgG [Virgibacillus halodenitrificans]MEC2160305.1 flagellar basal body rod protein FlgG [Virgibacillus halodenitrificans]MYL45968.1 flagellar basal body rod protein FlgG [Virgibacillus halodenitrificans]
MLRSMYAGISGMKGFQTKLDVIGNNIANVNTSGFKKGRVTFQDMMSQMTSGAQGPTATRGGVNPNQVGLGSQLGTIDNIHTQGFRQTTNSPLDFALEGDGMFVVADDLQPNLDDSNVSYSRAGNFYLDDDGYVVNPQGLYLIAVELDENGDTVTNPDGSLKYTQIQIPENAKSFSVQSNGIVNYIDDSGDTKISGQVLLANFSNPAGLQKDGSNLFLNSENAGFSGYVLPESEGSASIISGSLEMSNVDLSEEFTEMITAQRGFQANTRIITTSDEILQELVNLKR